MSRHAVRIQHALNERCFSALSCWLIAGIISHRTDVGHPAPPLSWVGSHEAVLASCIVPRGASDGKHGSCKQSQRQPPAQVNSGSQQNAQMVP